MTTIIVVGVINNAQAQEEKVDIIESTVLSPVIEIHAGRPLIILNNTVKAFHLDFAYGYETNYKKINLGMLLRTSYATNTSNAFLSGIKNSLSSRKLSLAPRLIIGDEKFRFITELAGGFEFFKSKRENSSKRSLYNPTIELGTLLQVNEFSAGASIGNMGDEEVIFTFKAGVSF